MPNETHLRKQFRLCVIAGDIVLVDESGGYTCHLSPPGMPIMVDADIAVPEERLDVATHDNPGRGWPMDRPCFYGFKLDFKWPDTAIRLQYAAPYTPKLPHG